MKNIFKISLAAGAVCLAAAALDSRLEVSYYDVESDRLPDEFDGFKIAHISDYHNCPVTGLNEKIKAHAPDMIAMTGDMTSDREGSSYLPAIELISELVKLAPCFIVSGNHDTWRNDYKDFVASCKNAGAHFLQNETYPFERNGRQILISGMEDVFTKVRAEEKAAEYLDNFSVGESYQILLFHRANLLDKVKDFGFDLILSGHLHGGQVRIPYIGGVFMPLSSMSESSRILFPKYSGGLYQFGTTSAIVNRGIGNPMIVPRVFNRPELGIITLKST